MSLNTDKTELMIVGTKSMLEKTKNLRIHVQGHVVHAEKSIKYLKTYLYCELSWQQHINITVKKVNYHILGLHAYRNLLHTDKLILLVETQCLSLIKYMSLIWGAAANNVTKPRKNVLELRQDYVLVNLNMIMLKMIQ